MNTPQKNPETGVEGKNLWLGLILAGTAFAVNGFLGFVIVWRTCYIGHGHLGALSFSGVRYLLAGITAALFATAVYGGWHSYRNWQSVTIEKSFTHAEAAGTAEFVSMLGVLCSTFLGVGIVWFCVGLVFLPVCERAH
jgi:hypothetical protein